MKYCPYCGTKLNDETMFCPECGQRYVTAETVSAKQQTAVDHSTGLPVQNITETAPQDIKQDKSPGKKKKVLIPVCIALVLAILAGVYFAPYHLAKKGNFSTAGKLIFIPSLYDQTMVNYVIAGLKMEAGDYKEAEAVFRELPADFNSTTELLHECMYQQALDTRDPLEAYRLMKKLADSGYEPATKELPTYKEVLYAKMQAAYHTRQYDKVKQYSTALSDYRYSDRYGFLASIRTGDILPLYKGKSYTKENAVPVLLGMSNFEDALSVLVSDHDIAKAYLKGTWKTKNGNYYFKIDSKGSSSYNLPSKSNKEYYSIYDSVYVAFNKYRTENGAVKEFSITPVSKDEIKIYCYKDKKTYALYKQ